MRNFWVTRQEETLALTQGLQHCAERSGMPPGVLCNEAWDLQRCMVQLMCLEGGEIVEVSLLGPADDGPGMSLTLEEEAVLLGDEPDPQEAKEATTFPVNTQKPLNQKNQPSILTLHAHLPPQPQHQVKVVTGLGTPEDPGTGLDPGI